MHLSTQKKKSSTIRDPIRDDGLYFFLNFVRIMVCQLSVKFPWSLLVFGIKTSIVTIKMLLAQNTQKCPSWLYYLQIQVETINHQYAFYHVHVIISLSLVMFYKTVWLTLLQYSVFHWLSQAICILRSVRHKLCWCTCVFKLRNTS